MSFVKRAAHVKSVGLATTIHTPNFGDDKKLVAPFQMEAKQNSDIDAGYVHLCLMGC